MAKSGKVKKPTHIGHRDDTIRELLDMEIEFAIHYPASNSAVFTIAGNLSQEQLRAIVGLGGVLTDGKFRILVTESGSGS